MGKPTTNVLFLNHVAQMSGAEQSLRALLWQLRRAHPYIEPSIALPGAGPFSTLLRDENFAVSFAPLRRIERPAHVLAGLGTLSHILRVTPSIARLVRRSGAQILHSNSTTAHLVGGLAARHAKCPAIWHARDLVSLPRIAPALASRARFVVAIAECVAENLRRDGVPTDKIRVIYNGLDPDEWRARPRPPLRAAWGWEDAFVFGCPSQLVPWKNHREFIHAAALLCEDEGCRRARFAIMGGDLWGEHAAYVAELRALVAQKGLQERFAFVPHQSDNVAALSALDAIVLPSRSEPFGRVLIEGMALQKVVIAFALQGPKEIVTHEHDGLLVAPWEPDGLAKAMRRALLDEPLRVMLQTNARRTVEERFHIADSVQNVVNLYRDVGV